MTIHVRMRCMTLPRAHRTHHTMSRHLHPIVIAVATIGLAKPVCAITSLFGGHTPMGTSYSVASHLYGKYYSKQRDGTKRYECNTYYMFSPDELEQDSPIIVEYHGGGFTGGSATGTITDEIAMYIDAGFHFASMDYRLVTTKYFYDDPVHGEIEEEFILAASDGRLMLDTNKSVMSSYKVKIGRQEFNTKCSFDAAVSPWVVIVSSSGRKSRW